MNIKAKKWMAAAVLGAGLLDHTASAGYLNETFQGYLLGTNLTALSAFQWGASDSSVIVTNAIGTNGSYLADLPAATVASNAINVAGGSGRIWTECSLSETYGVDCMAISTNELSGSVAAVAMSTGGYVMVYNPAATNWLLCTNDVVGSNVQAMALGSWPKVSLCVDYGRHETAVFLNGRLLAQEIPFITNLTTYGMFTYKAGTEGHSYLDDVSVSNAVPAALAAVTAVNDSDDDGRLDAQEIDQYGSIAVTGRLTIATSATNSAGGTVTPQGSISVKYNGTTNFAFASAIGYVVDHVWTNDVLVASYDHVAETGAFTWAGVTADGTFKVGFYYDGKRYVPGDYGTVTAALAEAQAGDRIVVSNAVYAESLTLSNGVMLVGSNMTGTATNLEVRGSLTVAAGATGTVSGVGGFTVTGTVTVAAGSRLVITNITATTINALSFGNGGSLQVCNGTLMVDGLTLSGSFTLDEHWGGAVRASTLNVSDSFDTYAAGDLINHLGWYGWGASSNGAIVQGAVAIQGPNAALIPERVTISNTVSATGLGEHKVWTDFWWRESDRVELAPVVNPDCAVELFVGTNNYVSIYNNGAWDVCSNDYWGATNTFGSWGPDEWHRVTVFQNFDQTNAAFFLDGRLLRLGVPFINKTVTSYSKFSYVGGNGNAYLDAVKIWTNPPTTSDGDGDGIDDAVEIHQSGNTSTWPRGSVFKIR
jgi:hypothetical protein